ncbi:ATP-dependent helicase [bacterium]|nr:ATP-dependent helicase [bacterium]
MDERRETQRYQLQRTSQESLVLGGIDWSGELNEQQLEAVRAPDGPVLVLAGAGSGKTRVITYRVAYLIAMRRIQPENILLATFTNKAARNMLERCEEVAGPKTRGVTGGTFHHIANLQLRRYAKRLGYDSSFTILDESDARAVMKLSRSEAGVDLKELAFPSARLLVGIASMIVNTNTGLESLLAERYLHLLELHDEIERVLINYHERKLMSNQMDFDDLLVNFHKLLAEHPEVREALARRFIHVLVDEYQDVNHIQAAIVSKLFLLESGERSPESGVGSRAGTPALSSHAMAAEQRGLFVVVDDAQSIYSFRGADFENIRGFPYTFPAARIYKLETNYRSVPQVLTLANGILAGTPPEFKKTLRPVRPAAAERPLLLGCHDAREEADFVAEQVLKLREEMGIDYRMMAVLYRAHANRLNVELEFTKRGIPFVVRGGLRFFEQAHIKDLLSYLLVLANSRDELAWQRMLGMCRRVGPKTIARVLGKVRGDDPLGAFTLNGVADSVKGQGKGPLIELRDFLRKLRAGADKLPAPDLIRRVLDGRYKAYLELAYENWCERLEDLEQLAVFAARFDTLASFLAEIGLNGSFSGAGIVAPERMDDCEEGAVTLSTIHQAKGLEWQVVFIIHCQDEVIPHRMSRSNPGAEEEERRLLYVAVTRTKDLLFMSFPQVIQTGDFQRLIQRPSRFLENLPAGCYDEAVLEWSEG